MKVFKKIIHTKLAILVFILLPLVVFTLVTSKSNIFGGIRSFVVLTGSMEPTIQTGSIVYVKSYPSYNKGEIISFTNKSNQTITHRISNVNKENGITTYQTKGDANNTTDKDIVNNSNIIGKQIFSVPYIGRIVGFLQTPTGFAIFIVIPTLLFIGFELWNIKKEIDRHIDRRVKEKLSESNSE